ncbi:tetratricopeptide repeat protein [Kurthia sibirica]|uniref:Tetratrico peptide repeat group 5 domain-containing protein n=1 Tax=Kurthia sibirica TaxID=202750 RepID=A0A2U3AP32_9BACL|nr:tetratricopeptide repeat protein [Kurthia sibirica]PWI26302.1 hypothetical protein DEX24_02915 [Kurthia sibirica]GEK35029.1 hypothetical protein KSI01_25620 [Kurthia sibirica]
MSIERMLDFRKNGHYEEAKTTMLQLLSKEPFNAYYHYQMAWCYDNLSMEKQAIIHYEQALQIGLDDDYIEAAYLGYGSTCRSLGMYEKAATIFEKAIGISPNNGSFKTFYAMTLYNLDRHSEAMTILLQLLVNTTKDEEILLYKKAINFYSTQLDTVWDSY